MNFQNFRYNKTIKTNKTIKIWKRRRKTGRMKIGNLTVGVHNTSERSGTKLEK